MNQEKINEYMGLIEERAPGKYDTPGIYSISIGPILVYIGKSMNIKERLANHLCHINQEADEVDNSHKYEILREANQKGYPIYFDVMYRGQDKEDVGQQEGFFIRKHLPPLNYQIPKSNDYNKFFVNKQAKKITLQEILGELG